MIKKIINTEKAPAAVGPYSQAIIANNIVFLSGQIGLDPKSGKIISKDFKIQAQQAFKNMQAVIEEAGGTLNDIVKLNLFLTDLDNFSIINDIMSEFLPTPFPARSTVGVSSLPKDAQFEVEAILAL